MILRKKMHFWKVRLRRGEGSSGLSLWEKDPRHRFVPQLENAVVVGVVGVTRSERRRRCRWGSDRNERRTRHAGPFFVRLPPTDVIRVGRWVGRATLSPPPRPPPLWPFPVAPPPLAFSSSPPDSAGVFVPVLPSCLLVRGQPTD